MGHKRMRAGFSNTSSG